MKSLAKNSIFNIIYTALNMLFPLIISIYVSRVLLTEGVGKVAYAQNIVSYFITFAGLGLPMYGTREIAKIGNNNQLLNKLFSELFIINAVSTTVVSAAFIFLIFGTRIFNDDVSLLLACGIQLLFNYINIDWFYRGREEYVYIVIRSIMIKIASIIAILLFVRNKDDYIVYALVSSLAACGNYVFNIFHARKYVKFDFKGLHLKKHMTPVIVLALITLLSTIYNKVDVTMLGILAGDAAVGLYSNSYKIIEMTLTALTSISAVFLPRLSYYYKNDRLNFFELINKGIDILLFLALPATAGVFLLAPDIVLVLFGESFLDAGLTIRLFSPILIIKSFADLICYQVSISTENEKKRLPTFFVAALLNVIMNYILIPKYLQNGAVIASIISELAADVIFVISMRNLLKIKFNLKNMIDSLSSTAIMILTIYIITLFIDNSILKLIFGVFSGLMVYILFNYIIKNKTLLLMLDRISNKVKR